jgi:DMSO reductase anchor subunit
MIYACIRFIQEWAHPLTVVNYTTLGPRLRLVTAGALAVLAGEPRFAADIALGAGGHGWRGSPALSLRRNARLKPKSTTQTATGIQAARVVQKSMGMTGLLQYARVLPWGFGTRMRMARTGFQVLAFALPILLLAWALLSGSALAWLLALGSQAAGLLAERWFFFAQARHPQNIYYQAVS